MHKNNLQSNLIQKLFFTGLLGFIINTVSAQDGNLIREKVKNKTSLSYQELKQYEGLYEYKNNTTLKIVASPIDTILVCIINESRYPFTTVKKNIFMDGSKNEILFLRDKSDKIIGYVAEKDTFKLLTPKINLPQKMWYPRLNTPKNYKYIYAQPTNDQDGLITGNLDNTGLDKNLLAQMVEKIVDGTYPNVHSVLILKDGKLVFEEYFYEHDKNKLHELRSASKSFISALTGIAVDKGFIKSVDEKVLSYFPEYTFNNMTEGKKAITIENLLSNSSGLDCDVYNPNAAGNESTMSYEKDWIQYSLDLPMNYKPGEAGQYCSSNPIIMGRIIEKATKVYLPDFAKQTLFKDLGIKKFDWLYKTDPSSAETFCQLNLRSRDFAKLGLLYLKDGKWNGKQVISKEWVEQSWAKHSVCAGLDYGYLWWTRGVDANGTRYFGKLAQGNGGQKLYVFKELNLITIITAGHYNMQSSANELNAKYILPAFNK
jgi:CubicO group peptidase (beta-lactamase class C family)